MAKTTRIEKGDLGPDEGFMRMNEDGDAVFTITVGNKTLDATIAFIADTRSGKNLMLATGTLADIANALANAANTVIRETADAGAEAATELAGMIMTAVSSAVISAVADTAGHGPAPAGDGPGTADGGAYSRKN